MVLKGQAYASIFLTEVAFDERRNEAGRVGLAARAGGAHVYTCR